VLAESIRNNLILANLKGFCNGPFLNQKKIEEEGQKNISSLRIKTPSIDEIVGQLSGGNQQKVVIGKWVNTESEIFIFDEPTRGIDIGAKKLVLEYLVKLNREEGMTVIIVSSELVELRSISDRIAIISDGKLACILKPDDSDAEYGLAMSGAYKKKGGGAHA